MAREELPPIVRDQLMDEKRMAEIALMLLKNDCRQFGTEMFIAQLKIARIQLGIEDEEMEKFFKSIVFDMLTEADDARKTQQV